MADIRMNVTGDASGGVSAIDDMADAVGKSVEKHKQFIDAIKAASKAVADFVVSSVQKYSESERVQRQLARTAGEYTDALSSQAEALSRLNAIDDDVIKQSEMLLTQWGGVGAAAKKTEQAILDYAAATGKDAVEATNDLIRNVESGGTGLAKLGVHFKSTGDKGHDLAAAVEALNKKFGGAAKADANSLSGTVEGARLAFDDLSKAFGEFLAKAASSTQVLPKLTGWLREMKESLFTPGASKQAESKEYIAQQVQFWEGITSGNIEGYKDFENKVRFTFEEAQENLAKWQAKLNPSAFNIGGDNSAIGQGVPDVTGKTNKGFKDAQQHSEEMAALHQKNLDDFRDFQKEWDAIDEHARQQEEDSYAEQLQMSGQFTHDIIADEQKRAHERATAVAKIEEENAKMEIARQAKTHEQLLREDEKWRKEMDRRQDEQARQSRAQADAIGAAIVGGITDQLQKLSEGGEFDPVQFMGDILATVFATAATLIGSAYGMPALGAAIGNLGATGIKYGFTAASGSGKKKKHDGGWAGTPRYHAGTWVGMQEEEMAILQTGERVLSRAEVGAMGGARAVDAAARGGGARGRGGITINVQALDAKSAAESFESQVGRGMRRALASGRGDLGLFAEEWGPR